MQLEVTSVTQSKKGTFWVQTKLIEGDAPKVGDVLDANQSGVTIEPEAQEE